MIHMTDGADVDVGFGSLISGHKISLRDKSLKCKRQLPASQAEGSLLSFYKNASGKFWPS